MIEACPTCLGYTVCLFCDMSFRKSRLLSNTTPRFLMQMDLCLDLELRMRNYLRFFLDEVLSQ